MSDQEKQSFLASGNLLSISQAAQLTPYSPGYLGLRVRRGKIKAVKIGYSWLTTREAVLEYVEAQKQKHARIVKELSRTELMVKQYSQSGFAGLKILLSLGLAIVATSGFLVYTAINDHAPIKHLSLQKTFTPATIKALPSSSFLSSLLSLSLRGAPTHQQTDGRSDEAILLSDLGKDCFGCTRNDKGLDGQVLAAHTTAKTSVVKSVPPISLDQQIKNLFYEYAQQGLFGLNASNYSPDGTMHVGSPSAPSLITGLVQNPNGQSTAMIGSLPIVTYVPANPSNNFNGASVAGFTDLSSNSFTTQTAIIQNALTVQGNSTITGSESVAGNFSAATTSLASLTVTGSANFTGSTTIAGLTVTGLNPGLTVGSVAFQNASGLSQDNSNFFYDATNHRLGLGTTTPSQSLTVAGNALITGNATTSGNSVISGSQSLSGNLNVSGLASLATTTITNLTVSQAPTVSAFGTGIIHSSSGGLLSSSLITNADITNTTIDLTAKVTGILPIANGGTNNSSAYTAGSVIYSDGSKLTQDNANFFWDSTNHRLGIGNASPPEALSVTGKVWATNVQATNQFYSNASTAGTPGYSSSFDSATGVFFPASSVMAFSTAGSERVRITANGNLGVGTSTPSARLSLTGTSAIDPFDISSTSGASLFHINNLGAEAHNGLYGSAGQILQSNGNSASPTWIATSTLVGGLAFVQNGNSFGATGTLGTLDNNALNIITNNLPRITVTSGGNVGFGTQNPAGAFEVAGQCVEENTKIRRRKKRKNNPSIGSGSGGDGDRPDEWEDIPVKDILTGDEVLSLNEETGEFEWQLVEKTHNKGMQESYTLVTENNLQIETTGEHPYLFLTDEKEKPQFAFVDETFITDSQNQTQIGVGVFVPDNYQHLILNEELRNIFLEAVEDLRKVEASFEFKFQYITPRSLPYYKKLLRLLEKRVNHWQFTYAFENQHAPGRWEQYLALVKSLFEGGRGSYSVIADYAAKPKSAKGSISSLPEEIASIVNVLQLESQGSIFLQIADILLGAVAFARKGGTDIYKKEVAEATLKLLKLNGAATDPIRPTPKASLAAATINISIPQSQKLSNKIKTGQRAVYQLDESQLIPDPNRPYGNNIVQSLHVSKGNQKWLKVEQIKKGMMVATAYGWQKVKNVYKTGVRRQMYDLQIANTHNFVGNDIVAHNTAIFDGRVDVGTSTPATTQLFVQGSGSNTPFTVASSSGSTLLTVLGNGNVGIGTTSPSEKLHIVSTSSSEPDLVVENQGGASYTGGAILLKSTSGTARGAGIFDFNSVSQNTWFSGTPYNTANGQFQIGYKSGASVDYSAASTANALLTVLNSGNVGIGTTGPNAKTEILSTASADASLLRLTSQPVAQGFYKAGLEFRANDGATPNASFTVGRIYGVFDIGAYSGGRITIASPTGENTYTDVLTVKNGNVGIGTTNPVSRFHTVVGSSYASGASFFTSDWAAGTTGSGLFIGTGATSGDTYSILRALKTGANASGNLVLQDVGGNVGIGTTSPSQLLSLQSADVRILMNGTSGLAREQLMNNGTVKWYAGLNGDGITDSWSLESGNTPVMLVQPNGNVGIGTTSPVAVLSVSGASAFAGGVSVGSTYAGIAPPTGGMIINGNVGIGTTAPSFLLDIYNPGTGVQTVAQIKSAAGGLKFGSYGSGSNWGGIWSSNVTPALNNYALIATNGGTALNTGSGNLQFNIADVTKMNLSQNGGLALGYSQTDPGANNLIVSGNVGIGTTTPQVKLDVNGGINLYNGNWISFNRYDGTLKNVLGVSTNNYDTYFQSPGASSGDFYFRTANGAGNELVTIKNNGNVGIGTTSPARKLEVYDATVPRISIDSPATVEPGLELRSAGVMKWLMYRPANSNDLRFYDATGDRVTIQQTTGNVGIGTTSPNVLLTIGGSLTTTAVNGLNFGGDVAANWYRSAAGTVKTDGILSTQAISTNGSITVGGNVSLASGANSFSWIGSAVMTASAGGNILMKNSATTDFTALQFGAANSSFPEIKISTSTSASGVALQVIAADGTSNANLLISGNVGIGTTSPAGKLQVSTAAASGAAAFILQTTDNANGNSTIRWQNNAGTNQAGIGSSYNVGEAGDLEFLNGNTTNVIIRSSGNVGIGTTGPNGKLEVVGDTNTLRLTSTGASGIAGIVYTVPTVQNWSEGVRTNGNFVFNNGNIFAGTDTVTIQPNGNVGIGTTTPLEKLNIYNGQVQLSRAVADTGYGQLGFDDAGSYKWQVGLRNGNHDFHLYNNIVGADSLTVLSTNGNVGIGTTSPGATLDIKSGVSSDNLRIGDNGSATTYFKIGRNTTTGHLDFTSMQGAYGYTFMSGNVGIGTTGPNAPLEIKTNSNVATNNILRLSNTAGNTAGTGIVFYNDTNAVQNNLFNSGRIYSAFDGSNFASARITIQSTNGTDAWIDTLTAKNGNVGIGTTSPVNKLDVNGTMAIGSYAGVNTATANGLIVSGNVGIGTSSPTQPLHVVTSNNAGLSLVEINNPNTGSQSYTEIHMSNGGNETAAYGMAGSNVTVNGGSQDGGYFYTYAGTGLSGLTLTAAKSTGNIKFYTGGSASANERMRIDNNGNVGIGTTAPGQKLHVYSSVASADFIGEWINNGDATGNSVLRLGYNTNLGTDISQQANGATYIDNRYNDPASAIVFRTKVSGTPVEGMRIINNGNVGIGTTGPTEKLHVSGGNIELDNGYALYLVNSSHYIKYSGTPDGPLVNGYTGVALGHQGTIDLMTKNGNVGIGTTSPGALLTVAFPGGGQLRAFDGTAGYSGLIFNNSLSTGTDYNFLSGTTDKNLYFNRPSGSQIEFREANSTSDQFIIKSGGNVGIGTTNAQQKLTLNTGNILFSDGYGMLWDASGNTQLLVDATNGYKFLTGGTEKVRIQQNGNVGIGTTSPVAKLEVVGTQYITQDSTTGGQMVIRGVSNNNQQLYFGYDTTHDVGLIQAIKQGTAYEPLVLNGSGGNVGIGTTGPNYPLDVTGNVHTTANFLADGRLAIGSIGTIGNPSIYRGSDTNTGIYWPTTANLGFVTGGTERVRIDNNGNVGIGTTGPQGILQIGQQNNSAYRNTLILAADSPRMYYSTDNSHVNWKIAAQDTVSSGLTIAYGTANSNPVSSTYTDALTVLSTGNVGIGTTGPNGALDVKGGVISDLQGSDATLPFMGFGSYWDGVKIRAIGASTFAVGLEGHRTASNATSRLDINSYISTGQYNSVPVASFLANGNVGIGTTGPGAKLEIAQTTAVAGPNFNINGALTDGSDYIGGIQFQLSGVTAGFIKQKEYSADNYALDFGTYAAGPGLTTKMTVLGNGNVGIGTTGPASKLSVQGQLSSTGYLPNSGTTPTNSMLGINSGNNAWLYSGISSGGNAWLQSSDITDLSVHYALLLNPNGGNVGIGTTGPGQKLDVNGNINASGTIYSTVTSGTDRYFFYGTGAVNSYSVYENSNTAYINSYASMALRVNQNGGSGGVLSISGGDLNVGSGKLFVQNSTGNVGIGTTSPGQGLSIGSNASGKNVQIANGWLCVDNNDTCTGANTAGTVYAVGTYTTGADVAENYPTNETLEAGDVVAANTGLPVYVTKASSTAAILGIVSTKPGVLLNGYKSETFTNASTVPVALSGRVPVKVTNENGNIKIGDYLAPSKKFFGYAMKATEAGQVLGRALENYSSTVPSDSGKILMFMQISYYQPKVADLVQNAQNSGNSTTQWLLSLVNLNMTQADVFGDIAVTGSLAVQKDLRVGGIIYAVTLNVDNLTAKKITTDQLCVEDVCVSREQFLKMVQQANGGSEPPAPTPTPSAAPVTSPTPTPTPTASASGTGSTTDNIGTGTPSVTPTPTPTATPTPSVTPITTPTPSPTPTAAPTPAPTDTPTIP